MLGPNDWIQETWHLTKQICFFMPIIFQKEFLPDGELGLWKIEENESYFLEKLDLSDVELEFLSTIKGHRKLEWLAGRYLVHYLSGRDVRALCLKDEFGKPYLKNSLYDISISHSREIAAVIAAPRLVGVDIQKVVEKIERIAEKFMRREELESLQAHSRLDHLHVYWGAKESLYKAYGRKQLDFKDHILIEPFYYEEFGGVCKGYVFKDDFEGSFNIHYQKMNDYILVSALEDTGDLRLV